MTQETKQMRYRVTYYKVDCTMQWSNTQMRLLLRYSRAIWFKILSRFHHQSFHPCWISGTCIIRIEAHNHLSLRRKMISMVLSWRELKDTRPRDWRCARIESRQDRLHSFFFPRHAYVDTTAHWIPSWSNFPSSLYSTGCQLLLLLYYTNTFLWQPLHLTLYLSTYIVHFYIYINPNSIPIIYTTTTTS